MTKPTLSDVATYFEDHARNIEGGECAGMVAYAAAVREAVDIAAIRDLELATLRAEVERLNEELHGANYRAQQAAWNALSDAERESRIKWAMNNPA